MSKNQLLITISIIVLSFMFALVSFAVYLSKGNSKFWLSKKIKIGALLLTFGSLNSCNNMIISCYDPPAANQVLLKTNIIHNLPNDTIINFNIENILGDHFSYNFHDSTYSFVQKKNLYPIDGKYDNQTETFEIILPPDLNANTYFLEIYPCLLDNQSQTNILRDYKIIINNSLN